MKKLAAISLFTVSGLFCSPAGAAVYTFSGSGLLIQDASASAPYGTTIMVTGIPAGQTVVDVDVTIADFSHTFPDDTAALIGSPDGLYVLLFDGPGARSAALNQTWVFDDSAVQPLPIGDPLASGIWQPSNQYNDEFPAPVPAGPHPGELSTFNGTNPNGAWALYVADYVAGGDVGSIGGWTLTITTAAVPEPATLTLAGMLGAAACLRRRKK